MWLALLVFFGRYALRPFWLRRPVWLRGFATEEEELGLKNGRFPQSNGGNGLQDGNGRNGEDLEAASNSAVEIAVGEGTEEAVESDSDNVTTSSASSTVVGFGRRNSVVDVRPVSIGGGFATLNIQSWHLMAVTLFLLSVAGIATSLILTFAAGHGSLYLTPVMPCVSSAWAHSLSMSFLPLFSVYLRLTVYS